MAFVSNVTAESAAARRMDPGQTTEQIIDALREQVTRRLSRRGGVVAMSGGVDSSVCAALAARAFGPKHVLGLSLPERESNAESVGIAKRWADHLGIEFVIEDVTGTLEACAEPTNATASLLRGTGADVVAPDDMAGMVAVVHTRYCEHALGIRPIPIARDPQLSRRGQTKVLMDALGRCIHSDGPAPRMI